MKNSQAQQTLPIDPQRRSRLAAMPCWADRPLAHKTGIQVVIGLMVASGGMCPKCGYGTKVTSKNWARCKKCDEKVRRVPMSDLKVVARPPGLPNGGAEARRD